MLRQGLKSAASHVVELTHLKKGCPAVQLIPCIHALSTLYWHTHPCLLTIPERNRGKSLNWIAIQFSSPLVTAVCSLLVEGALGFICSSATLLSFHSCRRACFWQECLSMLPWLCLFGSAQMGTGLILFI